ncbi:MAG: hypothetical protein HC836_49150 [Richelia sp. RM2_1_2]|nr:hypothetical protein [Richelia sp. RM2_1_2]
MKIEIINTRAQFQQILNAFSLTLYPQHTLPNLQCNEPIDTNFDKGFVLHEKHNVLALACIIKNQNLIFNHENTIVLPFMKVLKMP